MSAIAQRCVASYMAELDEIFPGGFAPGGNDQVDFSGLTPPDGNFLVLDIDGEAQGCGALRRLAPGVGEIKRMWLAKSVRGRGLGSELLLALEASALNLGIELVRLDTSRYLTDAIALYRRSGYVEVPAYNENPHAHFWFEKRLTNE